jgi:UDPglucose--hexose-1-phosphate uridylyltransferase
MISIADHPHRRFNPLTGEWTLVSPQRVLRPWQGKVEAAPHANRSAYDPDCYLCPGNFRASGQANPNYDSTYVFTNDFPALLPDSPSGQEPTSTPDLLRAESVPGTCRVLCYSPRHDLTLAEMEPSEIARVVEMWSEQTRDLGEKYRWVQVLENKGEIMGCSNSHPHGQIWAVDALPNEAAKEHRHQVEYKKRCGRSLLVDYAELESREGSRAVAENNAWIAVVPFWAIWPFETLLLPKRPLPRMTDLDDAEKETLCQILKDLLSRYDALFDVSFPYSMGWHGAPFRTEGEDAWQLHAHYYPPLLRSATIKKFQVGYEMLAEVQRDLTPEDAAKRLREVS